MGEVTRACVAGLVALFLAACGGGGGSGDGGGGGGGGGGLSLSLPTTRLEVSAVARHAAPVEVVVRINGLTAGTTVYVGVTGGDAIFSDGDLVDLGNASAAMRGTLRTDLVAGQYTDTITFTLCRNPTCTGSPLAPAVTATVVLTVLPNIEVAPLIELSRVGAQAAPSLRVPLSVPAPAGTLQIYSVMTPALIGGTVQLDGTDLVITTDPVRSGVYEATYVISSTSDGRYITRTTVRYTVTPPPGGERVLSVLAPTPALNLALPQGARVTQRIQVQPATWTAEPVTAQVQHQMPLQGPTSVTRISDTEFDLVIDLANYTQSYLGNVAFTQGSHGGMAVLPVRVDLSQPFSIASFPGFQLTHLSQAADLRWSSAVRMSDGSTATWTASVDQPWVTLRRSTGVTGQDPVELELNPDPAALPPTFTLPVPQARLTISVNQPGTLPITWSVPVDNRLPTLKAAAPGALLGASARVVVRGNALSRDLTDRGGLAVSGATLRSASFVPDPRFVGDFNVMLLELDGITAGQDVTLSVVNPVFSSSVVLPARAPDPVIAGRQDLPFGSYRPPTYSERLRAWYFASPGKVWKFANTGTAWAMQSDDNAGVVDVDLGPEEQRLLAAAPHRVFVLDANTLSRVATVDQAYVGNPLDTRLLPRGKSLASSIDGQVHMGLTGDYLVRLDIDPLAPTTTFSLEGPGAFLPSTQPRNIVVSADRSRVVFQHRRIGEPNMEFTVPPRAFVRTATLDLAHDTDIVAVSNDGTRTLDANGVVRSPAGNAELRAAVPGTHTAMGFGLTSDGRYGLVYAVRRSGSGAAEEALDPVLLVVDVRALPAALPLAVTDTLSMGGAVGCRLPRVDPSDECSHVASVSVDPVSRMALVLGPRGAELVPLPGTVLALGGTRAQALHRRDAPRAVRRFGG